MSIQDIVERGSKFQYMMLSRFQMDCDYYLGNGGRCAKHLYFGNPQEHVDAMCDLWGKLQEKPEWLTKEDLETYKKEMLTS